jgi:FkbM family methyltransferase
MKSFLVEMTNRVLRKVGYRAIRYPQAIQVNPSKELRISLMHAIGALRFQESRKDSVFRFLQIGALEMEGHFEPVAMARHFSDYRGILVDAQPVAVARLNGKYGNDERITIVHAAITQSGEKVPFFHVDNRDGRFPEWVLGLASLSKQQILKFSRELHGLEERIVESFVDGATIASLLDQQGFKSLDLFMIDAEGFDYELLRVFPFERMRPSVVFLEHAHLDARQREAAVSLLVQHGYRVALLPDDILAVREEFESLV